MKIRYIITCIFACFVGALYAQYQNYELKNSESESKTYVGRDYVRFLPGYKCSAIDGHNLHAKVSSILSTSELNTFLSTANPKGNPETITAINTNMAVGEIPISSSINSSGAKCYNVPIEIVPGSQGFQPNISLNYNSQVGNGIVGMGWSISGISCIERVNKNMFFDGENDVIKLSNDDAFVLDGVRLIKDTLSSTSTQYNFETVTGNTKVIAYLSQNSLLSPWFIQYFKVLYPNGDVGIFGKENNSDFAKIYFPVSKLTDINGNQISYTYLYDGLGLNETSIQLPTPTNQAYYIDEINYGGIPNITNNFAKIKFTYDETRPDQIFTLESVKSCVLRKRLLKIESFANTDLIRTYHLSYTNTDSRVTSNQDYVSRLTQISSFVNSGSALVDNLNPIKFYYGDNDSCTIKTTDTGIDYENFSIRKSIIGKFCADPNTYGLVSYYAYDNYTRDHNYIFQASYPTNADVYVYQNVANPKINLSSNNSPHSDWMSPGVGLLGFLSLDFDGNGKEEIVKINSSGITNENELINLSVFNTGTNYKVNEVNNYTDLNFKTYHQTALFWDYRSLIPKHFYKGNFTGNGKDEIICIPEKVKFYYNILIGDIDFGNSPTYIIKLNNQNEVNLQIASLDLLTEKDDLIFTIDIDGDSQTELLHVGIGGTDIYKYKLGSGLVKISHWDTTLQNFKDGRATFVDLNNDGNLDVILSPDKSTPHYNQYNNIDYYNYYDNWTYFFSNGVDLVKTINKNQFSNHSRRFVIQDVDEDNIPELLVSYNPGIDGKEILQLYPYSLKDLCFTETPVNTTLQFNAGAAIIPLDVNASINSKELILVDYYLTTARIISIFKSNTKNNQISLMINSLGITEKNDYNQLYQGVNYSPATSATFPNIDFQGPMWVTTKTSTMYNNQIINNTNYSYSGAIFHKQGLGLRGFSLISATDLMTNKAVTTEFDPYKMGAIIRQTSDTEESTFNYDFTDYSIQAGGSKKMKLLLTDKTISDKLRGNTVTETYPLENYNEYGNAGKQIIDYGGGITTTTDMEYQNIVNSTTNLIGMPTLKKVTNERNDQTFVQSENHVYYPDNKLHYLQKYIGTNFVSETEYEYNTNYGTLSKETVHNRITNLSGDDLVTSYTYWPDDQCSLHTKTDPFGLTTTYIYNFNTRLLTGVTDYLGKTVTYGFDAWRRKNYELRPDGTSTSIVWNWNTSDVNSLIYETNNSTGQPQTITYNDAFGRETRKLVKGFDGNDVLADKEYDNFGRVKSSSMPYKSGETPLYTKYSYDEYNRAKTVEQHNGSNTTYSYKGNQVTELKDGISTSKITDATGKTTSTTDSGGTVSYTYRADGQPESINTEGVVTSFEYNDPYNRQTKLIDPSAGTVTTDYDDPNHTVTQTWNSGKQISTISNKFGQPVTKTTPDFTTTYNYDPVYGRPTGSTSTNSTSKSIEYDNFGRLWKNSETVNGKTYQEVYGYDSGRIGSVTYNTGAGSSLTNLISVIYKYNGNGYLYKLEDGSGNRLKEVNDVNALGQEKSVLLGNGLTTTKNYTPEGLCSSITTSNNVQNMSFDFNRITGTLNSRSDNKHGLSESFTYDNLYRLKSYGPAAYHYTLDYNTNGNISNKLDAGNYSYTTNTKPYQLTGISNIPSVSAGLFNQLDITYTVNSRPTSIEYNGFSAAFTYNDDYDRATEQIKQETNVLSTKTFFAGGKYEIETTGGTDIQRIYLNGSPYTASIVLEKTGSASPQLYYLHRDYLGSITQITDNSGNLAAEYSYDAWGRMRNIYTWQPYTQGSQPTLRFGRGYTGHEHLNQFGLINMNARLYDPVLGRFYAPDPLVSSGMSNDFNRYIYGGNNPLMYTDPSGKSFKDWWNRNIAEPFMREFQQVFGNGFTVSVGTNTQFSSWNLVGAFNGPNGIPYGPGFGVQTNNWKTFSPVYANYQGGFYNTQSVNFESNMQKSVVQTEQSARSEYFGQKTLESVYNFMVNLANLAFNESEYDKLYGKETQQGRPIDFDNAMNVAGTTFGVGAASEKISKLGYKNFQIIAKPFAFYNAYTASELVFSPNANLINYMDFGVGLLDLGASVNDVFGRFNPYIGGATLIYGAGRIVYDYYQSNSIYYYGPIYNKNGRAVRLW